MYKCINGIMSGMENLFVRSRDRGLRGHSMKIDKPRWNLICRKNFFGIRVVDDWNKLPEHILF